MVEVEQVKSSSGELVLSNGATVNPRKIRSAVDVGKSTELPVAEGDLVRFTVNLKNGDDGQTHYAVFSVSLSLNTKSDGYETYGGSEGLSAKETIIQSQINTIVNSYTLEEFSANGYQNVKDDILTSLQDMFGGSDFIVGVNFSSVQTQ